MFRYIHNLLYKESRFENESTRILALQRIMYGIMSVYFPVFILITYLYTGNVTGSSILFLGMTLFAFGGTYYWKNSHNVIVFSSLMLAWIVWSVIAYGWNVGTQHFLFVLIVLIYFSFYELLLQKVFFSVALFLLRFSLYIYCRAYRPLIELSDQAEVGLQIFSTIVLFLMLTFVCGIFSTNIETAEKKLILYNAQLENQASTDPLTGLWNRRTMIKYMEEYMSRNANENFSIVLCDIDHFKHINDTWGHNCGDDVLCWITNLMRQRLSTYGAVCRWGGEEFLFFFPEKNGEEVYLLISDFKIFLDGLFFEWEDQKMKIKLTFGIEENDFQSDMKALVSKVDQKLYLGKEQGRNRIIY